jgi:hypothetical protein
MDLIVPKQLPNPEGQAKLILKSNGQQLVQPIFFKVDEANMAIEQANRPDATNWMGLPVFDTVTFDSLVYTRSSDGKNIGIGKMQLQNCMHIVSMVKNVITTPITGSDGTVKEYIGLGDYSITLSGMLINKHANTPPELETRQLFEFCRAPVPLKVASNFLSYFEIFSIVVTGEPTFTQIEGTRNAILFSIPCVSDIPFEVEYNQNNKGKTSSVSVPMFL